MLPTTNTKKRPLAAEEGPSSDPPPPATRIKIEQEDETTAHTQFITALAKSDFHCMYDTCMKALLSRYDGIEREFKQAQERAKETSDKATAAETKAARLRKEANDAKIERDTKEAAWIEAGGKMTFMRTGTAESDPAKPDATSFARGVTRDEPARSHPPATDRKDTGPSGPMCFLPVRDSVATKEEALRYLMEMSAIFFPPADKDNGSRLPNQKRLLRKLRMRDMGAKPEDARQMVTELLQKVKELFNKIKVDGGKNREVIPALLNSPRRLFRTAVIMVIQYHSTTPTLKNWSEPGPAKLLAPLIRMNLKEKALECKELKEWGWKTEHGAART